MNMGSTIIGVGTRKSKEAIDLKLKISTTDNSYVISIKDTEIEKGSFGFYK